MKSLIVGIITQLCVLVGIHFMFKPIVEDVDVCKWKDKGAARAVLVISQGLGSLGGRSRGKVDYKQTLVQMDELYPVLSGISEHVVYRHSGRLDSILKRADAVVYAGPSGMMDEFENVNGLLSFTYPRSSLSKEPFIRNDELAFRAIHGILHNSKFNVTSKVLLQKKVVFVIYLTSVALVDLKYPKNSTTMYETKYFIRKGMEDVQTHIKEYYSDDETVFVSVPQWSIVEDKDPKLSLWGRGIAEKFASNIHLVDVCPLLASLLGVAIPAESVGELPLSYLDLPLEEEAKALACNALQLHQRVFSTEASKNNKCKLDIIDLLDKKQYNQSKVLSKQVIKMSQSHLYTSPRSFDKTIFVLIVFMLVGWIFILITEPMVSSTGYIQFPNKSFLAVISSFMGIALCELLYIILAWPRPFQYIIFTHLSLLPWFLLLTRYKILWDWFLRHANIETLKYICSTIFLEEILLLSLHDGFMIVFLITIVCSLPLLSRFRKTPFIYSAGWYVTCGFIVGLLNFPRGLIKPKRKLLNFAATFWLCYGQSSVFYFNLKYDSIISQVLVIYMSFSTILANAFLLLPVIPPYLYYMSWGSFTALIFPLFGKRKIFQRLIHLSLAFGPPLLLLSSDIESLSYAALMAYVIYWVFLERSYIVACDDRWCDVRRGFLLALSSIVGYLLMGRVEEHEPSSTLTPFLLFHMYWLKPLPYYGFLFFKYTAAFTIVMTVYISLILSKWKADMGFVYGLLLIEMFCLRSLVQFLFVTNNISEVISKHILVNMFAIIFMLSYCLGLIYSIKYVKKEIKDLHELILEQNST